ncbi:LAMI_0H05732g1_1 [Lachancea mirantina]|uniref:glycerol kinase n=1 Tax=Lachancea mirantina TaxID=1230905 RepID=A0A1G4KF87_9SACH|nr:LAMI_0H05732g1_1 [Lachancea mirantina]
MIPTTEDYVPLVASIDVGTTSSRVILFNKLGQEVSKHQIEYSTSASRDKCSAFAKRRFSVDEAAAAVAARSAARRTSAAGCPSPPASAKARKPQAAVAPVSPEASPGLGPEPAVKMSRHGSVAPATPPDYRRPSQPIFSAEGIAIEANEYLEIEDLAGDQTPTLTFPKPGWVECKPLNILTNVVQCFAANVISLNHLNAERAAYGLAPYKVTCLGIASMRETTLVWSRRTGRPIVDYGIVWNDVRTAHIVQAKRRQTSPEHQERLRAKTGLPVHSTYFSCSKLRWLLDNEPAVRRAYDSGDLMFGTVDTWLIYHLTARHAFVSDVTNASRTGFMNLDTLDYDNELLEYWDVQRDKIALPRIVSSAEYYGDFCVPQCVRESITPLAWDLLSDFLAARAQPLPIQGCLGDQSASLVGQLAFKPGAAKCTYGTGCFLLYNTGTRKLISNHGALTTFGYWFPYLEDEEHAQPHFALEGSVAVAGAVVQWLRDNLRLIPKAEDVGPLASRVADSGGVVFVPAFSGLFAPYWDPDARATIMGMSQHTTASHIARAAVEGVCFQARAILRAMSSDAVRGGSETTGGGAGADAAASAYENSPLSTLAVDGGMSRSSEVMQIQADILGPCVKVRTAPNSECTALGAAIAASLAFKNKEDRPLWKDLRDVKRWVMYGGHEPGAAKKSNGVDAFESHVRIYRSQSKDEDRRRKWRLWELAIERSRGWMRDVQAEEEKFANGKRA